MKDEYSEKLSEFCKKVINDELSDEEFDKESDLLVELYGKAVQRKEETCPTSLQP